MLSHINGEQMHISTKTEYAVRGLAEIAKQSSSEPISIMEICERQKLPRKYMEQLFRKLKRAKIISSKKGTKGGYLLNKEIADITLGDIMIAVDDSLSQTSCENDYPHREFCIGMPCGFHKLWREIEVHLHSYFHSITLEGILKNL